MSSNNNEDKLAKWMEQQFKNIITGKLKGVEKEEFIKFMKEYKQYYINNPNNSHIEQQFYNLAYKVAGI